MASQSVTSRRSPMQLFQSLPTPAAQALQWLVSSFSSESASRSILPFIPRPIKWVLLVLFVVNARSWPGVWHGESNDRLYFALLISLIFLARVFTPVFRFRWNALLKKRGDGREFWTNVSPIGRSAFPTSDGSDEGAKSIYKTWAGGCRLHLF